MRVLVTGARGLVGRNLLEDRRAAEHVLLTPERRELDLRDKAACMAYFAAARPDLIIHLAGVVGGIQANIDDPTRFLLENAEIGLNVIDAARQCAVPDLLNVASSCMYPKDIGAGLSVPHLLTGALEPTNEGYALAKILAWKLTEYIDRAEPGLNYKTIIPCNLYGRHDHFSGARSHLVAAAVAKVVGARDRGEPQVQIWGDGTARREFMYAADLADFIWSWAPKLASLPSAMNIGVGADHSVTDYYRAIAAAAGYAGGFDYDVSRPAGMRQKLMDVSQQAALGWTPGTSLEDGLRETIAFYEGIRSPLS